MAAWRPSVRFVKCFAKRALADGKGATQVWNEEGFVEAGQRQHFGPPHQIEAGSSGTASWIFDESGPRMNGH